MSRVSIFSLVALALGIPIALLWSMQSLPAQGKDAAPAPTKWEYKMVYETRLDKQNDNLIAVRIGEKDLNALGAEGWELCGVVPKTRGFIAGGGQLGVRGDTSTDVYFIFKRPKR